MVARRFLVMHTSILFTGGGVNCATPLMGLVQA